MHSLAGEIEKSQPAAIIKGEMAEWSIAAVLKTVEGHTSGGSNPSLSAIIIVNHLNMADIQMVIFLRHSHE